MTRLLLVGLLTATISCVGWLAWHAWRWEYLESYEFEAPGSWSYSQGVQLRGMDGRVCADEQRFRFLEVEKSAHRLPRVVFTEWDGRDGRVSRLDVFNGWWRDHDGYVLAPAHYPISLAEAGRFLAHARCLAQRSGNRSWEETHSFPPFTWFVTKPAAPLDDEDPVEDLPGIDSQPRRNPGADMSGTVHGLLSVLAPWAAALLGYLGWVLWRSRRWEYRDEVVADEQAGTWTYTQMVVSRQNAAAPVPAPLAYLQAIEKTFPDGTTRDFVIYGWARPGDTVFSRVTLCEGKWRDDEGKAVSSMFFPVPPETAQVFLRHALYQVDEAPRAMTSHRLPPSPWFVPPPSKNPLIDEPPLGLPIASRRWRR